MFFPFPRVHAVRAFLLLGIISLFLFESCQSETTVDCSLVDCAVDQPSVYLEFFYNGESLLSNQKYSLDQISISSTATSTPTIRLFPNATEGLDSIMELSDENWTAGRYSYVLELGNDWSIPLEMEFLFSTGPCCGGRLRIARLGSANYSIEEKGGGYYWILLQ